MLKRIKSDASPDEFSSPYYINHQQICEKWEDFILGKNGVVKGKFTSWALIIKAKIRIKEEWYIELRKTTMSNSSILLPSKWNVLKYTILKCDSANLELPSFEIKQNGIMGKFKINTNSKYKSFGSKHLIYLKDEDEISQHQLFDILKSDSIVDKLELVKHDKYSNTIEMKFHELISDEELISDLISM